MKFQKGLPEGINLGKGYMAKLYIFGTVCSVMLLGAVFWAAEQAHPGWVSQFLEPDSPVSQVYWLPVPIVIALLLFTLSIPHEGLHLLFSKWNTAIAGFAPSQGMFYVAPYGVYSKWRAFALVLTPIVGLTLLPVCLATYMQSTTAVSWAYAVAIANAIGAGCDLFVAIDLITLPGPIEYTKEGWKTATTH